MASEHISSHPDFDCVTSRYTRTTWMTWWHTRILHDTLRYTGATRPHWCICLTSAKNCKVSVNAGRTSYKICLINFTSWNLKLTLTHFCVLGTVLLYVSVYASSLTFQGRSQMPLSMTPHGARSASCGALHSFHPWSPARCGLALQSRSFEAFWFSWSRLSTCWWVKLQDSPLSTFCCDIIIQTVIHTRTVH